MTPAAAGAFRNPSSRHRFTRASANVRSMICSASKPEIRPRCRSSEATARMRSACWLTKIRASNRRVRTSAHAAVLSCRRRRAIATALRTSVRAGSRLDAGAVGVAGSSSQRLCVDADAVLSPMGPSNATPLPSDLTIAPAMPLPNRHAATTWPASCTAAQSTTSVPENSTSTASGPAQMTTNSRSKCCSSGVLPYPPMFPIPCTNRRGRPTRRTAPLGPTGWWARRRGTFLSRGRSTLHRVVFLRVPRRKPTSSGR